MAEPALRFAELLRQLRAEARLTQEELADAAGLSPRSISDLERGINRTTRKDTAQLLADALRLTGHVRVLFVAAARGRASAGEVLAARHGAAPEASAAASTRALPRDIGSFTGREPELARLLDSLADVTGGGGLAGIYAIDGMAGIGKTTFAVHSAHKLAGNFNSLRRHRRPGVSLRFALGARSAATPTGEIRGVVPPAQHRGKARQIRVSAIVRASWCHVAGSTVARGRDKHHTRRPTGLPTGLPCSAALMSPRRQAWIPPGQDAGR